MICPEHIKQTLFMFLWAIIVSWHDLPDGYNVAFMICIIYSCWSHFQVHDCNLKHARYNQRWDNYQSSSNNLY